MSGLDANTVLAIGVSIIGLIWMCFIPLLLYLLKKEKEKKDRHVKSLNENILKKWVKVNFSRSKNYFSFNLSGFNDFKDDLKFIQAKQHIRSKKTHQKDIWIYWEKIENLIIEYSKVQKSLENEIKRLLCEKIIKTLPDIERKTWQTQSGKSYFEDYIANQIWADANELMENPDWSNPESEIIEGTTIIERKKTEIMYYPNLSNQKRNILDQQINHIIRQKAIQNEVRKLREIEKDINKNLKIFQGNLYELTLRLDSGEILEGKCDDCPK